MNRSTMSIVIYGVLAIVAIVLGLFVANLFGNPVATTPAQNSNGAASAAARTTAPAAAATVAPTTAATTAATSVPTHTSMPTSVGTAVETDAPATTAATAAVPTVATTEPTAEMPTAQTTESATAPADENASPAATEQSTATSAYIEYTVQPGDSLKLIARRYNVTVPQIIAINEIPNPDSLTIGSIIKIPTS